jgi:hypothetical protein
MSLLTYQQARPWAKAIKEEVLERRMPPWGAVKGFGDFKNDVSLSQEEISTIANWVEGGAPEGEVKYLPEQPPVPSTPHRITGATIPLSRQLKLNRDIRLQAIRPMASAAIAEVTATLPDGTIEPLLRLMNYKSEWNGTFIYRSPIVLPTGTLIQVNPEKEIALIIAAPKPARRTRTYSPSRASGIAPKPDALRDAGK